MNGYRKVNVVEKEMTLSERFSQIQRAKTLARQKNAREDLHIKNRLGLKKVDVKDKNGSNFNISANKKKNNNKNNFKAQLNLKANNSNKVSILKEKRKKVLFGHKKANLKNKNSAAKAKKTNSQGEKASVLSKEVLDKQMDDYLFKNDKNAAQKKLDDEINNYMGQRDTENSR
ncbi:hypothetical protein HK099_001579 [Clydaea vesicula]|uniref:Chromatin target of PRMT1 protein C-terminal domain-containing protein n=1 Tax=Clydaea vesicula TaxID=447962 RepID=A0AAD5XX26_9FUNG|nr:hypothetical protein HK099_001579 [Clydaea vesicula]KAJ3397152.1 hypothetical protein HDU92_000457 [Lobulomyces angularis]